MTDEPNLPEHPGERTASTPPETVRRVRRRRTGSGGFFAAWIGIGAILGAFVGAVLSATSDGPALVSAERSFMWLVVVLGIAGAFVGATAAVVVDAVAARRG